MKLVDIEQGSPEWLEFRRSKVGSSDAAVIMGLSPWKTPYQLWKQKIEGTTDAVNPAMREGLRLEPIARDMFTEETGISVTPKVGISEENPWQISSFDGITEDGKIVWEVKCGSLELYEQALRGEIPPYYFCQLQHHLCVAKADKAIYSCFYREEIKNLDVWPDINYIEKMLHKQKKFSELLMNGEPPELCDRDYEIIEHARGENLLKEYFLLGEQEKEIKKRKDELKEEIIEIGPKRNFIMGGTKIYQMTNSSYDYKKMREDGLNVDSYKKTSKPYWMISSPRSAKGTV